MSTNTITYWDLAVGVQLRNTDTGAIETIAFKDRSGNLHLHNDATGVYTLQTPTTVLEHFTHA